MTEFQVARSVGWGLMLGAFSGGFFPMVLSVLAMLGNDGFSPGEAAAWGLGLGLTYGLAIGSLVGIFLGPAVAYLAGHLRSRTKAWRAMSSAVAAAVAIIVLLAALGVETAVSPLGLAVGALAAAASWIGLGRVFGPDAVRARA